MDLDMAFVSAVLREGGDSLRTALSEGVISDHLVGDGKAVFDFSLKHYTEYKVQPSADLAQQKTGVNILNVTDPSTFFIEEIKKRRLFLLIKEGVEECVSGLNNQNPTEALSSLEKVVLDVRGQSLSPAKVVNIGDLGDDVITFYEKIKSGATGILSPWDSINAATLGFWPQDFILFVARANVGKSFAAIITALTAWQQGKKVLFVTTEMSQLRIATRFFSIQGKLPYGGMLKGQLDAFREEALRRQINEFRKDTNFKVIGGDFDFRLESLASAIDEVEPDFVVIDGVYLLRGSGGSRTEKAAYVFDELKRIAKRRNVPIFATTQLNREAKAGSDKVGMENISLSDSSAWNADLIYAMVQSKEMKANKVMKLIPLKIREGSADEIEVNWNFDTMDFSEIPPHETENLEINPFEVSTNNDSDQVIF